MHGLIDALCSLDLCNLLPRNALQLHGNAFILISQCGVSAQCSRARAHGFRQNRELCTVVSLLQ